MGPVTHALASVAAGRAGLDRKVRLAIPMLLVSSVAGDLDWLSYIGGARAFLAGHRTATDSVLGTGVIAVATAAFFVYFGRRDSSRPVRYLPALAVCAAGAGIHLLLDLTNSYGVKLLWPFSQKWYAWDLTARVDPWVLTFLIAGLLLPVLFGLINEEVGARPHKGQGRRGATLALAAVALYFGGRAIAHQRAIETLDAHTYSNEEPLRMAAFPESVSPLEWNGIVETPNAIDEIAVPVSASEAFDPDAAIRHFKPSESAALESARNSPAARAFLNFARFPLATVDETSHGYLVKIRDLRFASLPQTGEMIAVVELNEHTQVTADRLQFYPAE